MVLVKMTNKTRGTLVGDQIVVADTSLTRLFGLLGRRGLLPGEGLWIRPSSGVHTFGMRFAIDVIGLDKHLTVTKLWKNLRPFRATSLSWSMHSVVELPAHRIDEAGVQLGDSLQVWRESPQQREPRS